MKNSISGFNPAKDPQTGADYGYEVKSDLEFSLCANFNQSSLEGTAPYAEFPTYPSQYYPKLADSNWEHGAGYVCFERKIDPELYRQIQKAK